ncbi:PhzF family phenazine biosynthesis protein [Nocardia stercoris]|uniref:PhzF family phenazine biosynthesis protein n=1 Tax=Nocardia stercoris TaxID=2483361 RepID=A0A3M2L5D4_9NOCA|nr:PhzF family phenazine biosynthesis protein [Nocardia stercoris]RMI32166.1 PhzF family phenazine biosynthesis protein [Nocardia stercoris]
MAGVESDSAQIEVLRVFADAAGRFGKPVGVVRRRYVEHIDPHALAARVDGAETAIVGDPDARAAELRSYTATADLSFSAAAVLGAAWWLNVGSSPVTPVSRLVSPAGPAEVSVEDAQTWARVHPDWVRDITLHQFGSTDEIGTVDTADFADGLHLIWAFDDETRGAVRARMFAPAYGLAEDEANGAAAAALTAELSADLDMVQGQGSRLRTTWGSDGWVSVGGTVVEDRIVVL